MSRRQTVQRRREGAYLCFALGVAALGAKTVQADGRPLVTVTATVEAEVLVENLKPESVRSDLESRLALHVAESFENEFCFVRWHSGELATAPEPTARLTARLVENESDNPHLPPAIALVYSCQVKGKRLDLSRIKPLELYSSLEVVPSHDAESLERRFIKRLRDRLFSPDFRETLQEHCFSYIPLEGGVQVVKENQAVVLEILAERLRALDKSVFKVEFRAQLPREGPKSGFMELRKAGTATLENDPRPLIQCLVLEFQFLPDVLDHWEDRIHQVYRHWLPREVNVFVVRYLKDNREAGAEDGTITDLN